MCEELKKNNRRENIIQIILLLVFLAICSKVFYLIGPGKDEIFAKGRRIALEKGEIIAPRGRILDSDSKVLAWSEKYYDLCYNPPRLQYISLNDVKKLIVHFPEIKNSFSNNEKHPLPFVVIQDISPQKLEELKYIIKEIPFLKLQSRVVRLKVSIKELQEIIGEVDVKDDKQLYGISGLEKRYNKHLSGRSGLYEVVLDRNRNWIKESWKLTRELSSGQDVKLKYSIQQLIEMSKEEF